MTPLNRAWLAFLAILVVVVLIVGILYMALFPEALCGWQGRSCVNACDYQYRGAECR